MNGQQNIKKMI